MNSAILKTYMRILCSVFQVGLILPNWRGQAWILELKSRSDLESDNIFEISDPKYPYSDTLSNFSSIVNFAHFKGSNLGCGAQIEIKSRIRFNFRNWPTRKTLIPITLFNSSHKFKLTPQKGGGGLIGVRDVIGPKVQLHFRTRCSRISLFWYFFRCSSFELINIHHNTAPFQTCETPKSTISSI